MGKNAYFKLDIRDSGVTIQIFPPEDGGRKLDVKEVTEYLDTKGFTGYNLKEINDAVTVATQEMRQVWVGEGRKIYENEQMEVTISSDKMLAFCRFYPPSNEGALMTEKEILDDLQFRNVSEGIDEDAIHKFLADRQYCVDYIFAKGTPPVNGEDAWIEYFFNTNHNLRPKRNEDGSVDYRELNTISRVEEGQMLAKLHPAVPGKPGKDVCGGPVQGRQEKNLKLDFANNITLSDDKTEIYSNVTGHASLVNGKVFVADVYDVPADVDNATGNIVYDGNVTVKGNVKSGFSVSAKGDIVIEGVVEAAFLKAGGQIIVKRGINGMSKGRVSAKGNIIAKFIENSTVISGGYIETGCILHSKVSAEADIRVRGKKGFVSGGLIRAGNVIEAQTMGSAMGTDTQIEVGAPPALKVRYEELDQNILKIKQNLDKMRPILVNFNEKLQKKEEVPPERVQQVQAIAKSFKQEQKNLAEQQEEMKELHEKIQMSNNAKVKIKGTIYPGVTITISEVSKNIKSEHSCTRYVRERGEIVARPL